VEGESEILAALVQRVPSAVFSQHQPSLGHPHAPGVDDLVRGFLLQVTVLMDAGFVREGVAAHDGLIGLRAEGNDGTQHLARCEEMFGVNPGRVRVEIVAGLHDHHDFLERAVARTLADAVDGALDLPGAGLHRRQRIGHRKSQVVMAVHADNSAVAQRFDDAADQRAILARSRIADRVGNVYRAGARGDHRFRYPFQIIRIGARAIFRRELDVIYITARQLDRGHGVIEHLFLRLLELVLQVDVAGRDERMDARAPGMLERSRGSFHVERAGTGQSGHRHPVERAADRIDGFEVNVRRNGKTGLENVHAQLHQLVGHAGRLGDRHAAAGRLLAIAQRGVENIDAVAHISGYSPSFSPQLGPRAVTRKARPGILPAITAVCAAPADTPNYQDGGWIWQIYNAHRMNKLLLL